MVRRSGGAANGGLPMACFTRAATKDDLFSGRLLLLQVKPR